MTPNTPIVVKKIRCNVVQETQEVRDNDDDNNQHTQQPTCLKLLGAPMSCTASFNTHSKQYFTDEETGAQRGEVISPNSHSNLQQEC